MAKLTITPPSTGEKDSVAEPKVGTALKAIETWANGEVGTSNIAAGNVTEAMLATAVQEKLTSLTGIVYATSAVSLEGVSGKLYKMTVGATTLTLPAPTVNRLIGVYSSNGCKVTASSGKIYGDFISPGQTTVELSSDQHLLVFADGSNWLIIAGEAKREQTYGAQVARVKNTLYEPSASRPTLVVLEVATGGPAEILVGGVVIALEAKIGSINTFICPAGVKWELKAATVSGNSSYLTL
jgi:hypothetical protein